MSLFTCNTMVQPIGTKQNRLAMPSPFLSRHRPLPTTVTHAGREREKEKGETVTGIVFKPFKEVDEMFKTTTNKGQLNKPEPEHSFARMHYPTDLESAINEQINIEYNISYVYHSLSNYFYRDNVALNGLGKYFLDSRDDEVHHAQLLIDFQNTRGGRVKLLPIISPDTEFDHPDKGDALYAMELALSLEKLNYEKLLKLWDVADKHGDPQAPHWIEDNLLDDQVADIKKAADYVSQLRRIGRDGHGVWHWDYELYQNEIPYRTFQYATGGGDGAVDGVGG